jgi:hypothetical protein
MNHLFVIAIIVVAGCLPSAAVFSQAAVHRAFKGLSAQQIRSEFEAYETKGKQCAQDQRQGKKCAAISFSAEKPLNIPVQGRQGAEWLTFRVSISTPLSEVREMGYEFGKIARQRTPADRADIFDRLVIKMQEKPTTIVFVFRLIERPEPDTQLSGFTFAIMNAEDGKLWSTSQPDFGCHEFDLTCRVVVQKSGLPVAFPLFTQPGSVPFIDDTMRTLTLVVVVDDHEEKIHFDLTGLG